MALHARIKQTRQIPNFISWVHAVLRGSNITVDPAWMHAHAAMANWNGSCVDPASYASMRQTLATHVHGRLGKNEEEDSGNATHLMARAVSAHMLIEAGPVGNMGRVVRPRGLNWQRAIYI